MNTYKNAKKQCEFSQSTSIALLIVLTRTCSFRNNISSVTWWKKRHRVREIEIEIWTGTETAFANRI